MANDRSPAGADALNAALAAFMEAARECALQLIRHAAFIERELSAVSWDEGMLAATQELCEQLESTGHDTISELITLQGSPALEPAALGAAAERILEWLSDDILRLHDLVGTLEAAAGRGPGNAAAYILVAESAANILDAYNQAADAAEPLGAGQGG
jgi:hypothetical protein